jgi:hypothetical protein
MNGLFWEVVKILYREIIWKNDMKTEKLVTKRPPFVTISFVKNMLVGCWEKGS